MTSDPHEIYRRGVHLADRGRHADALRALTRAASIAAKTSEVDLGARIAGTIAYILAQRSDAAEGVRLCRQALERPGISRETVAILHGQLGSIEMERGHLDVAAEWLTRSISGLSDDPVRAANMRMNRSMVDMRRGRLEPATEDLRLAEAAYRDAGLALDADQAVHNRGYVHMLAGDLVSALEMMQRVRAPLDGESSAWAAINELDRAEVLRDAGLVTEAERSLESVATVFGRAGAKQDRSEAEYHLARSLLYHAPERAARVASYAARRFRALGNDGWATRADALRLRALLTLVRRERAGDRMRPRPLPSADAVAAVLDSLEANGNRTDAALLRLTYELARLTRTADPGAISAPPRRSRTMPVEVVLLEQELKAERARARGREGDVRRHAAVGVELLERARRDFGSLDLTASATMQGTGVITAGLASAVRSGKPEVVFEWSERARHLSQQMVPLRPPPDRQLASDLAELRRIRVEHGGSDWLTHDRAARLRDRARERQWSRMSGRAANERIGIKGLRAELGPDDAALSYVFDGVGLSVVMVTARAARFHRLDWHRVRTAAGGLLADMGVSASVRSGPMVDVVRRSLNERLTALSATLVEPLLDRAGEPSRVVITSPGVLAGVPWAMLPALVGRPVAVAPSASGWVHARTAPRPSAYTAGFVVGPRVVRGAEEIRTASKAWSDAPSLVGDAATAAAVTSLGSQVDVLHIAAHGRHAADNPMFSGLELADGTLFGYDIDLIEKVPDTVILSACEVGRSSVRWGEEAVGMTRVWLHAGTRSVVAAPVIVADDDACELLAAMHEGLAAGDSPSEALAAASERTGIVAPFQVHGAGF